MQTQICAQTDASSINGDHVRVVTAAHAEIYLPVVRHDDRSYGQAVRCDRREDHSSVLRHDERSADGEVIGSTAGRRGDDKTVRVVGVQQLAVHLRLDAQHVRQTLFEDGYLVQRVGRHDKALTTDVIFVEDRQVEQDATLNRIFPGYQLMKDIIDILGLNLCQKSQMATIDAEYRNILIADSCCAGEEGTVTTNGKRKIYWFAIDVLRLLISVPVLRKTRVLAQV